MEYKDYYKIMGLARTAKTDEIKKTYRKLARKYHPDVSKEPGAEEKFKAINEAYEVLKDEKKRAAYDELGSNWQAGQEFRQPHGWNYGQNTQANTGGFENMSDFFESLFGGGGRGASGRGQRSHSQNGEDLRAKITVTLEEAHQGAVKQVQLPIQSSDAFGRINTTVKTLKIKIPPGVLPGQNIRLTGQGGEGSGRGTKGDLYLEIDIAPHAFFELKNKDVYCNLPIAPWEAALGATLTVPTLAGKSVLKIPASSQGGQKFRLKGLGMPGTPSGDLYYILKIVIPTPQSEQSKELFKKMAAEMPFNPRSQMNV